MISGTLTSVDPLLVRVDGDSSADTPVLFSLIDSGLLSVDDRVRCELVGNGLILHGRKDGFPVHEVETVTVSHTTASLAHGSSETVEVDFGAVGFTITHFETSHAARVILYQSEAYRTADASRPGGVRPGPDSGVIHEEDGSAAADYATNTVGGLLGGEMLVPMKITNLSGVTREITVNWKVTR